MTETPTWGEMMSDERFKLLLACMGDTDAIEKAVYYCKDEDMSLVLQARGLLDRFWKIVERYSERGDSE